MEPFIQYVATYPGMYLNVFLVIVNRLAYIVNFHPDRKSFDYICPCCMDDHVKLEIKLTLLGHLKAGRYEGKVRWCCHENDASYGDSIDHPFLIGRGVEYCAGSANEDLDCIRDLIYVTACEVRDKLSLPPTR